MNAPSFRVAGVFSKRAMTSVAQCAVRPARLYRDVRPEVYPLELTESVP